MQATKTKLADAYPLQWPVGWPRTPPAKQKWSRYRATLADARDGLLGELRLLGAVHVVISTDMPVRRDGLPYASGKEPTDRGVAVYFVLKGATHVIACDKWRQLWENMQALRTAISALRQLERTGASEILERAFAGFAALPAEASSTWRSVLGFGAHEPVRLDEAKARWKRLSFDNHPDRGGQAALFHSIQDAWASAQAELHSGR